jgi:hypothetical protein
MNGSGRWLFVAACVLASAAVVQDFRFEASADRRRAAIAAAHHESNIVHTKLAELRGGQTAYLATGQGPEFWMRRVTDLGNEIDGGLARLRSTLRTADAQAQLTTASQALAELLSIDKRARQAIDSDQRFLASDIVFAEGLTPSQALADAVSNATAAETGTLERALVTEARLRLAMLPAVVLLLVASAIIWAQSRRQETPASDAATTAQMLRDLPPPVKPSVPVAAVTPPARAVPPGPAVDFSDAADLCVDLARVLSQDDIPALLTRAAGVLNASGLVVWVTTQSGSAIVPALWHGYSDRVIGRLGSLDAAADNITSACFRTVRPQSMPGVGQPGATSAIAVPLVTAEGCHGVLSAELQVAKPATEVIAIARILAAQLASMTTASAAIVSDSAVAAGS